MLAFQRFQTNEFASKSGSHYFRIVVGLLLLALFISTARAQTRPDPSFESVSVTALNDPAQPYREIKVESGNVTCDCSLLDMLSYSSFLNPWRIVGPSWLTSSPALYHLDARLPAGASLGLTPFMIRRMLADRFHLVTHSETRDVPVYALGIAPTGLKLKRATANPSGTTVTDDEKGITLSEGAMTFSFLAFALSSVMDKEVVDRTANNAYYEINFQAKIPRRPPTPGIAQKPRWADNDPRLRDVPTIFVELQKLGIKLELSHAPLEHLVIDKADQTPTPN